MFAFIGVDLAWQSEGNHSGLAVFTGDRAGAKATSIGDGATSLEEVCRYILDHRSDNTVVAIDAPLIIANAAGQRPCETLVSKKFGSAHAGAHTSNLKLYPNAGGVALARMLEAQGFRHCTVPGGSWNESGDWFFEVYPHPAQVVLFGRDRIIRYKKGAVVARRSGLDELRKLIRDRMLGPDRPLVSSASLDELLTRDLNGLRGRALKRYEDTLDAVFCAYLAFHLWRWGWERSEVLGDLTAGYIVVPTVSLASRP